MTAPAAAPFGPGEALAELHTHLGGSVPTHILWEIAHNQGIALPTKDYWEFCELIAVGAEGVGGLDELDAIYSLVEHIQSSPAAVEQAVHAMIGGGYRSQRITTVDVRFCPAKRNRGGEWDLDHVILAACRAVDRATLEYPQVNAGIIIMADRSFDTSLNNIVIDKALAWQHRGVVGVDVAGPRPHDRTFEYRELADAFGAAREAGLGVTVHCGEEGDPDEIVDVIEHLRPHRIGHGVLAWQHPHIIGALVEHGITLELCPTSNLRTGVFDNEHELANAVRTLANAGVSLTVNTDGPTMMGTSLRAEHALLVETGALTVPQVRECNEHAHAASFSTRNTPQGRCNRV